MNIFLFVLISVSIFIVLTVVGLVISKYINKNFTTNISATSNFKNNGVLLAQALPSRNQYVDFRKTLEVVVNKYPNSYNASGQVYTEQTNSQR